MSKLALLKIYVKYNWNLLQKSIELVGFFKSVLYRFWSKNYLHKYNVLEELQEAFIEIETRARPLSEEFVQDLQEKAFAQSNIKEKIPAETGAYWYGTDPEKEKQSSTFPDIWYETNQKEKANQYSGEFGDIKDEQ